jgi:hypothetical protein
MPHIQLRHLYTVLQQCIFGLLLYALYFLVIKENTKITLSLFKLAVSNFFTKVREYELNIFRFFMKFEFLIKYALQLVPISLRIVAV